MMVGVFTRRNDGFIFFLIARNKWRAFTEREIIASGGMRNSDMGAMSLNYSNTPTMGFLIKRVAETWMTGKMRSGLLRKACRILIRF